MVLALGVGLPGVVFGFYFALKAREIWPKLVEVLGNG